MTTIARADPLGRHDLTKMLRPPDPGTVSSRAVGVRTCVMGASRFKRKLYATPVLTLTGQ